MPFSSDFKTGVILKKPENYGDEDTLFFTKSPAAALTPNEVHFNVKALAKEVGRIQTISASKTFTAAELNGKWTVETTAAGITIDIKAGADAGKGTEFTIINTSTGVNSLVLKTGSTLPLPSKIISTFIWDGTNWKQTSADINSGLKLFAVEETNFPIGSVKMGLISKSDGTVTEKGLVWNGSNALHGNFNQLRADVITSGNLSTSSTTTTIGAGTLTISSGCTINIASQINTTAAVAVGSTLTATGQISALSFNVTSKREFKENIDNFTQSAVDLLNNINVVSYNYKSDENKIKKVGFIADDTDTLFSGPNQDTMDLANCIGVLIRAVQELAAKIK